VIGEAKLHSGRDAVRFMNPAEIVMHQVERDSSHMVLEFL
jgi:hypothetical protein